MAKITTVMSKPLNLEVMFPCPAKVDANVCWHEVHKEKGCCMDIDNPRIITKGNDLEFTFNWVASGPLFDIMCPPCQWCMEVRLENLGSVPDPNLVQQFCISHNGQGNYSGTVTFKWGTLAPYSGDIFKPVAMLHLNCGSTLVVCGFEEFSAIHIQ